VFELHAYMRENNLLPAVNNLIEEDESEPSDFINDEIWNMNLWDNLGSDDSLPSLNLDLDNTLDDTLDSLASQSEGYCSDSD
jgi:hypothetical protein